MQKVFVFSIGKLPNRILHPFLRRRCERALTNTPGLLDWCEMEEGETLLFFGTVTHAEKAMNALRASQNPVGEQIFLAEQDRDTCTYHIRRALEY